MSKNRHVITLLLVLGGVAAGLDLVYAKHPHVKYEAWLNFYGFAALVATVLLSLTSQLLRPVLERGEDYYDG